MKILVMVKWVIDFEVRISVKSDGSGIDAEVDFKINEYDERAVGGAVDFASEIDAEVVVVSVGPEDVTKEFCFVLVLGCDRVILVEVEDEDLDGDLVARILAVFWKEEEPDFFLLGC